MEADSINDCFDMFLTVQFGLSLAVLHGHAIHILFCTIDSFQLLRQKRRENIKHFKSYFVLCYVHCNILIVPTRICSRHNELTDKLWKTSGQLGVTLWEMVVAIIPTKTDCMVIH